MDCYEALVPREFRDFVEPYASALVPHKELICQSIGIALITWVVLYAVYAYYQSAKEAAVAFNVPVPPEVRKSNAVLKKWEDVSGPEKQVLEDQVRGVSVQPTRVLRSD